jgi:hypothetical protein
MANRSKHVCVANRTILKKDNIVSHNTQIHDGTLLRFHSYHYEMAKSKTISESRRDVVTLSL